MRALRKPRKLQKTAQELEAILAERFGVPVSQVSVRAMPDEGWTASLLVRFPGNAEKKARFWTLVYDAQAEFEVKG